MRVQYTLLVMALSVVTLFAYTNCSNSGFSAVSNTVSGTSHQSVPNPVTGAEANVMSISMSCGYVNEPCVSVTICTSGGTCQTIPDVLLDTGSYGLRVFSSVLSSTMLSGLPSVNVGGNPIAECVSYADGSSDWGPVVSGNVQLGNGQQSSFTANNVPIQLINSTYGKIPSNCTQPDTSPQAVHFNGILGVGLFVSDCGVGCSSSAGNGIYYTCTSSSCSGIAVPEAQQVSNPVAFLQSNNNGVIVQLPSVPSGGATSLSGYMIIGIDGMTDNTPASSVKMFPADANANFKTSFNGTTYSTSFIDSGSNGLYFPGTGAGITSCSNNDPNAPGFFCPTTNAELSAVQLGATGSTSETVNFEISNASNELANSNPDVVFDNLGADADTMFDWGLPFFLGRTIYVGINGTTSSLGTGPYWAY